MDDAVLVGVVDGPRECFEQAHRRLQRLGISVQALNQAAVLDVLQREVRASIRRADVENLHDIGVVQAGDRLGFLPKTLVIFWARVRAGENHLQGDQPVERLVPGLVDDAHPPSSQLAEDLVTGHDGNLVRGRLVPIRPG